MRVLIFEDEKLNAERLVELIRRYDVSVEVLAVLESVKQGVEWLTNHSSPDLIFMDIRLTDGLSFELFEKINIEIPVIFTTAYDEYAIRAFKVNSVDYIVKPLDFGELKAAIDKFKKTRPLLSPEFIQTILKQSNLKYKNRFLVKIGDQFKHIECRDILCFIFEGGMVMAVTKAGSSLPLDYSLDHLEQLLDPADFFRLNRKIIARIDSIKKIHSYFNGRLKIELVHPVDEDIIVSRERAGRFKDWLGR
ncbi:MAG: response regulator transcription factor [Bacteroidales bacterium]|nr:response regulator transcription factor [Bacteroidales bacterium]